MNRISRRRMRRITDPFWHVFPNFRLARWKGCALPDHNHGDSATIGLQEMLMQCFGDKILILPCWDKNIDVDFKLHAPKQSIVEVSFKDGKIKQLNVTPPVRAKDVILMLK